MLRYYITNRREGDVIANAKRAIQAGVEMIQVREKDLPARDLLMLVTQIRDLAKGSSTKVLVNDRLDVALAARIDGVHLPGDGLPPELVRPLVRLLGASVHSVTEAVSAEQTGVDFVVFGPIFDTPGKKPVGLSALRRVASAVKIPVLGIGGVNTSNIAEVMETGAAGIAAIRMFSH